MERQWLQGFFDSGALAIGCWNADGRFTAANQALLDLIGYSRAEVENGTIGWASITPPEYAALDARALEEIRAVGRCNPFQKEYVHKDGRRVSVLIGGAAFGEGVTDAGTFYAVNLSGNPALSVPLDAAPDVSRLRDRQRVIALMASHGLYNKAIAFQLGMGTRTVELEKQRIAELLNISTAQLALWAVENRQALLATFQDAANVPDAVAALIGLSRGERLDSLPG